MASDFSSLRMLRFGRAWATLRMWATLPVNLERNSGEFMFAAGKNQISFVPLLISKYVSFENCVNSQATHEKLFYWSICFNTNLKIIIKVQQLLRLKADLIL